jgi:hypothetical protein
MMYFYVRQHCTFSVSPATASGHLVYLQDVVHDNFVLIVRHLTEHIFLGNFMILRDAKPVWI